MKNTNRLSVCWISVILTLFGSLSSMAQTWEDQPGEIEETEVVIEKNIQIVLPFAARNFEKIPPQPIAIKPGALSYRFISTSPEIQPINPRLRAVTIKDEEIKKLYGGYLKGGFGNYVSPLLRAYIFTKRNEKLNLGLYGNYLASLRGPVDKENSASSDLNLGFSANVIGEDAKFKTIIDYKRLGRYFYGYPDNTITDRDTIKQVVNRFAVNFDLDGELSTTPWLYNFGVGYRIAADDYDASENEISASGGLGYKIGDDSKITIRAGYSYFLRKDSLIDNQGRSLLSINPAYDFVYSKIQLHAGLGMILENDTIKGFDKFHVYPDVTAAYNLTDGLRVYAGVGGRINTRSLDYWLQENPFLKENTPIYHSNTNLDVFGGFNGKLANPLGFNLGISVGSIKNMSYMVNDSVDISKFTLVYDSLKTSLVAIKGGLSWQKEKSKVWFEGVYNSYKTGAISEAWHMPQFEATLGSSFNIYNKILFSGNFNSLFGLKAYDPINQAIIELDPVLRLDLEVDYLLSKIAGIFVQANNVFATKNTQYYRYPSRGFQVIAGINFSF